MADGADRIGLLGGTGDLGFGLALRLAAAGVPVTIGSRVAERAADAAERVRAAVPDADVDGAALPDVGPRSRIVFVCVPFSAQADTLKAIAGTLVDDVVVVDATVPLGPAVGGRPTQLVGVWEGSAAQRAQALLGRDVQVVGGLHTIGAAHLAELDSPMDEDALICGDDKAAKRQVAELLEQIPGLGVVDCGKLDASRLLEGFTPVLIGLNIRNKTRTGIRITGLVREPDAAPTR